MEGLMLDPNARPVEDEPLREEDVTAGDRLDDRVSEGEGLPESDEQGATLAADKIRRSIATHDFGTAGNWRRITVSCGAATIGVITRAADEAGLMNRREYTGNLLREAFQALETGRSAGTNRTSVGALRS